MSEIVSKTLAETCEVARAQYETLVELERQQEDLRCQLKDLSNLALRQAVEENPETMFRIGEVVEDDQGLRYRITSARNNNTFPSYTRGASCGDKTDEFSPNRFLFRHYEGILLRKNGTPAWGNGRSLWGKLKRA